MKTGLAESQGQALALMDLVIAEGAEERVTSLVEDLTGREPVRFEQFVMENIAAWSRFTTRGTPGPA